MIIRQCAKFCALPFFANFKAKKFFSKIFFYLLTNLYLCGIVITTGKVNLTKLNENDYEKIYLKGLENYEKMDMFNMRLCL